MSAAMVAADVATARSPSESISLASSHRESEWPSAKARSVLDRLETALSTLETTSQEIATLCAP